MFYKKLIKSLFFLTIYFAEAFDWEIYVDKNNLRKNINYFSNALVHFAKKGIQLGLRSSPIQIKNTNFDWKYYVKQNNITNIHSKEEAIDHYNNFGKGQNLKYCKRFKIAILFHLYNLELMDIFINKINFFMENNPNNDFYIKINIPIDANLNNVETNLILGQKYEQYLLSKMKLQAPYHSDLINDGNKHMLNKVSNYLKSNLKLANNKIQIIFSENRGQDIGGFFILLDQLIKQDLKVDYIVKLHTKTREDWRKVLTSFLNVKINKLLTKYECIYSCRLGYPDRDFMRNTILLDNLLKKFNLPAAPFNFCAGTMFVVSSKFIEFVKNWDFLSMFKSLNLGKPRRTVIEHAYERFFGYIFDHLKLKTLVLDYYSPSNDHI